MSERDWKPKHPGIRRRTYEIIFEADTRAGSIFDVVLLLTILLSIFVVMFESVNSIYSHYGPLLRALEWVITILFTLEYALRLWCCGKPRAYARSFFGVIDLAAIIPTYLSLVISGSHYLVVVRAFRLLRMFRILKMGRYLGEARVLVAALHASRPKITVFLASVVTIIVFVGTLMHLIEGPESGFTNIPISMYWAVVTLTTVGYGDIAPQTVAGQLLASLLMICGYGIIAVPTGIVSVELSRAVRAGAAPDHCRSCGEPRAKQQSQFCHLCGTALAPVSQGA